MKNPIVIGALGLTLVVITALVTSAVFLTFPGDKSTNLIFVDTTDPEFTSDFPEQVVSPELEALLLKKIEFLRILVKDPVIVEEIKNANKKNEKITPAQIAELDQRWTAAEGIDSFVEGFLTNVVSTKLIEYQLRYQGFLGISVTDQYGLNVGQTDKTIDYYQGDEEWWRETYDEGRGKAFFGRITFDEKIQVQAFPIYVPVVDGETNTAIGVARGVFSFTTLKGQL